MPALEWSLDTSNFSAMVHGLADLSGAPFDVSLVNQTGVLLNKCVEETPKKLAGAIETSVRFKNRNLWENESPSKRVHGDPIISITKSNVVWYLDEPTDTGHASQGAKGRNVNGKTFHIMNDIFRWNQSRWARFQAALAQLNAEQIAIGPAVGSRGLAARSWVQIAESLGIDLSSCGGTPPPGFVRNAKPSFGSDRINGHGRRLREGDTFFVEIVNDYPALADPNLSHGKINGYAILQRAMDKRAYAFAKDMEFGVFDSIAKRASRYPGIFVA